MFESTKQFYESSDNFFDYVASTFKELAASHHIVLVTGEPQFVAEAVGEFMGADAHYSSKCEVIDGIFSGRVKSYLASRHEKHDAIKHLMESHFVKHSFAFGDSEGDIEMLRAVEYPICLNATEGLRAIAIEKGWHMPEIVQVTSLVKSLNSAA